MDENNQSSVKTNIYHGAGSIPQLDDVFASLVSPASEAPSDPSSTQLRSSFRD